MTDQATPAEVRLTDGLGPLVERLRAYPADPLLCDDYSSAMLEAADEIERLRECLQWLLAGQHRTLRAPEPGQDARGHGRHRRAKESTHEKMIASFFIARLPRHSYEKMVGRVGLEPTTKGL